MAMYTAVRSRTSFTAVEEQLAAVTQAGLSIESVREPRVGVELREPFRGSESFYRDWHGLPIVLVVRACK